MALTKGDFYYGALLSRLVKSEFLPAIFEEGEERRIYQMSNNHGDYLIYAKYSSKPNINRSETKRWSFRFSEDEIFNIKSLEVQREIIFAFVCGTEGMIDSRLSFLTKEEFKRCIGVNYQTPDRRVSITHDKGSPYFMAYGTALDSKDAVRFAQNVERRLEELSPINI